MARFSKLDRRLRGQLERLRDAAALDLEHTWTTEYLVDESMPRFVLRRKIIRGLDGALLLMHDGDLTIPAIRHQLDNTLLGAFSYLEQLTLPLEQGWPNSPTLKRLRKPERLARLTLRRWRDIEQKKGRAVSGRKSPAPNRQRAEREYSETA